MANDDNKMVENGMMGLLDNFIGCGAHNKIK